MDAISQNLETGSAVKQPLLSVVVPVRNRPELVVRALDSIVSQTCRDFNLIIVDNGSTDNTVDVIEHWISANTYRLPSIELISECKPGAPAARNKGLAAVTTPYVAFFDSDDVMRPRHISRIISAINRNPEADLFRWPVLIIDDEGWSSLKDPHSTSASEMQLHLLHSTLATHRWAARTELVRSAGGWDEDLGSFQDYELGVRLLCNAKAMPVKINGEPTVAIYPSDDSISHVSLSDRFDTIDWVYDKIDSLIASDSKAIDTMRFRRMITAAMLSREGNSELARKMKEKAYSGASTGMRMKSWIVGFFHRIVGKGGSSISLLILR